VNRFASIMRSDHLASHDAELGASFRKWLMPSALAMFAFSGAMLVVAWTTDVMDSREDEHGAGNCARAAREAPEQKTAMRGEGAGDKHAETRPSASEAQQGQRAEDAPDKPVPNVSFVDGKASQRRDEGQGEYEPFGHLRTLTSPFAESSDRPQTEGVAA
jgi:hypothetical protein